MPTKKELLPNKNEKINNTDSLLFVKNKNKNKKNIYIETPDGKFLQPEN